MLIEQVSDLLREVAAEAVMPRFRKLAESDVRVKSPGEEVTIADEEAERLLNLRLPALLPGSRVIGEEAVSAQPELLQGLGEGTVFVVDPVDGTANFVKGSPCFSMMVALLREGVRLNPLSAYYTHPEDAPEHTFLLSYSALSPEALDRALKILAKLL